MKNIISFVFLIIFCFNGRAQNPPSLLWENNYGGTSQEVAHGIQQTTDEGFVIVGYTFSSDGDVTGNHGSSDYWIVKTDNTGTLQWQKCYGGSNADQAYSIEQTTDGGYIIAGLTESNDGDVTGHSGFYDFWVVKTDQSGTMQWQKCYGDSDSQVASSLQQTNDGGYIIAGHTNSIINSYDFWIVKTDDSGNIQWQKSYGGSNQDDAQSVQQTADGGYIIAGFSSSNDGDVSGNHGNADYWVVKTDVSGNIQWQKTYGGSEHDIARSIQQTTDGGYIIAGESSSNDGDVSGNHGSSDFWVVKTDPSGTIQWQKCFGGLNYDFANTIQQTTDGGYVIGGASDYPEYNSLYNLLIKVDSSGEIIWQNSFGSSQEITSVKETIDGGLILGGNSLENYWAARLCYSDPISINISDTSYCLSTTLTATDGFESYLWNTGETTQMIDVTIGGNYSVVATNSIGCTSNTEIYAPAPIQPYDGEQICMVTMDEQTGNNLIIIEKTLNVGTDSILIYRMDNYTSQYICIGAIGIDEISIFEDEDAIPEQQSYQYKISVKDIVCGKESDLSDVHRTILLQSSVGINNDVNLLWNPYEGFTYSNFQIYRSNANGAFNLIAYVPNNNFSFTDLTPPSGLNRYQVRVSPNTPCNLTRSTYNFVSSNIVNPLTVGIDKKPATSFSIKPNPVNDHLSLRSNNNLIGAKFRITDLTGRVLLTSMVTAEETDIDLSSLSAGVYILIVEGENNLATKIIKK